MAGILDVKSSPVFDDRVTKFEWHTYSPCMLAALGNNDEIRIACNFQDVYTLPSESYIFVEGKIEATLTAGTSLSTKLVNNAVAFLFEEVRYEIGGVEIDRTRHVGITSTIKNSLLLNDMSSKHMAVSGWRDGTILNKDGYFSALMPLRCLLGFAEDFGQILINLKQELVLVRSRSDNDSLLAGDPSQASTIKLTNVQWRVPHVTLSDAERLKLMKQANSNQFLPIAFRRWETQEIPKVLEVTSNTITLKTASSLEKPRYLIVAFQTGRRSAFAKDNAKFDHCKLTNLKVFLNDQVYPYSDINVDFEKNRYGVLYDMYSRFNASFYDKPGAIAEPLITFKEFKTDLPIFVIDCSRSTNDAVKGGSIDCRLEFETSENVPKDTVCYVVIVHDKIVRYNPLTNLVQV